METTFIIVALVALLCLILAMSHYLNARINAAHLQLEIVKEENEQLKAKVEELQKPAAAPQVQATAPEEPAAPESSKASEASEAPAVEEPAAKHLPMHIGERKPAVRQSQPMAVVAGEERKGPEVDGSIAPEIVAAIVAAIAAYGYSPASIRSIKPHKTARRESQWVLAGRLSNMR